MPGGRRAGRPVSLARVLRSQATSAVPRLGVSSLAGCRHACGGAAGAVRGLLVAPAAQIAATAIQPAYSYPIPPSARPAGARRARDAQIAPHRLQRGPCRAGGRQQLSPASPRPEPPHSLQQQRGGAGGAVQHKQGVRARGPARRQPSQRSSQGPGGAGTQLCSQSGRMDAPGAPAAAALRVRAARTATCIAPPPKPRCWRSAVPAAPAPLPVPCCPSTR